MVNYENICNLIEEIESIKTLFSDESLVMASSYSFEKRRRENHSMTLSMIYNQPKFIEWKAKMEYELSQLKQDQLITDILKLFNRFTGWSDKKTFSQLEAKLLVLSEHLKEYEMMQSEYVEIDDLRIPERELSEKILGALCKLQKNTHYSSADKEDTMNDFVRDMLSASYEVNDQTRQGESVNGNDAGEVDIQIRYFGLPVVMIEGIKLDSLKAIELDEHVNKVLTKYDPNGCPYAVVIVYATGVKFDSFCDRLFNHLDAYEFPYDRKTNLVRKVTPLSEIKHMQIILDRNSQNTLVHFFVVHMT